ncbi:UNVERIFIED_CONTAM: Retrovirus-related Pol polyprotein from transposon TNT 1-94 [Sesamum angustifolium]|uniref:Retrovirus-related Pol polyprotein from transposon TNT 1-94 n=1 Tax=Sesamum angustifolium TaxID=2727405 RepID=A0AAW2NKY2_9LAMI
MKTYFQSQKLWEIVEEGNTLPEDSSTSSSAEKGKLENKKAKDSEALYYNPKAVADQFFPRISVATSAKEHGVCKRNIKAVQSYESTEDQSWLWHRRLGHFNFQGLKILHQKKMMTDLPQIQAIEGACEACLQGKQHKKPFPSGTSWRAKAVLELIHTDVCGPMRTPSHEQNRYFIIFIDDYSRMTWVYFMREKSEVLSRDERFDEEAMGTDEEKKKQSLMIPKETASHTTTRRRDRPAEMERRSQQAPGSPRRPPPSEEIEEENPPRKDKASQ